MGFSTERRLSKILQKEMGLSPWFRIFSVISEKVLEIKKISICKNTLILGKGLIREGWA